MTTPYVDTSTLSDNLHSFYFKTLLESAEKKLVVAQLGMKKLHPKRTGKESYVLQYSNLDNTSDSITEGVTPSESEISTNKTTITLSQYGRWIGHSDVISKVAIDDVVENISKRLGYAAAKSVDSTIIAVLIAGATNSIQYVGAGNTVDDDISATEVFTALDVIKGVRVLRGQDAPEREDGYYTMVVHSLIAMDMMSDTSAGGIIELNKYVAGMQEKPLKGEVGKAYGAKVIESNNISSVENGSSVNVYRGLLCAQDPFVFTSLDKDFIEYINKEVGSSGAADPLNQRGSIGYKMMFGSAYVGGAWAEDADEGASPDLCVQIRGAATGG